MNYEVSMVPESKTVTLKWFVVGSAVSFAVTFTVLVLYRMFG